jgi:cytochrome c
MAMAAGDATAGQRVFSSHCAVCHATEPGVHKLGPSLAGVVGTKSGSVSGFNSSATLKNADVTWDDANLDKYLANPSGFIRGAPRCSSILPTKPIGRTSSPISTR